MSEEFQTLEEGVTIHSCGDYNSYYLYAFNKNGKRLSDGEYSHVEYAALIKQLWESFLEGKQPRLIGYKLPVDSLIDETIHFLSPANLGECPLPSYRTNLLHWLEANVSRIQRLNDALERIITAHIQAKRSLAQT